MKELSFQQKLQNYARLIVQFGLNVQPGQLVDISAEACHRDFVLLLAEEAYARGAKCVFTELTDARQKRLRLLKSREEDLSYLPAWVPHKYKELVDAHVASLGILGPEDPDIISDIDPKRVNIARMARYQAIKYFYDEGIDKNKVHWSLAAAATPKWAQRIFPALEARQAEAALWEALFKIARVDRPDFLELWGEHNRSLKARAARLNEMQIQHLHFTGPGTDLKVGLSRRARFRGGQETGPFGVGFEANIPTEECFTTPDWRMTEGKVRATRPIFINGKLVKELLLEFKAGEIMHFSAKEGAETFREFIGSDPGAKRLGEVALVGTDSPVYQSGLVFEEILLDENAACHIAIGSAYLFCIEGGSALGESELNDLGFNRSSVHTDTMISSEHVDVTAETYDGKKVKLIEKGRFCPF